MTTQVAFDNPCLLLEKEFSCQRGLCCKLQLPSFCAKWRLLCLLSFKYFSTHGKNVYEQLTVYGVVGSLFSVLWNDFISKRYMFLLLYQQEGHCKIKETKLLFLSLIVWLDGVNTLVNHTLRSWKSLEILYCF